MKVIHRKVVLVRKVITWFVSIALMPCFAGVTVAAKTSQDNNPQPGARQLWEQAVEAKGGRERLYAIHNAVILQRGILRIDLFRKKETLLESLLVFPNKLWVWNDMRPSVFGLILEIYDYDKRTHYRLPPLINPEDRTLTKPPEGGSLLYSFLPYLPETKWLRPLPVDATIGKIGFRKVDIVQTTVNGRRVDFALDQKSHLPVRISYYGEGENQKYVTKIQLHDYTEVRGIKVPRLIKFEEGSSVYKLHIQFNVEYDPDIFSRQLSVDAGPGAWAKRR